VITITLRAQKRKLNGFDNLLSPAFLAVSGLCLISAANTRGFWPFVSLLASASTWPTCIYSSPRIHTPFPGCRERCMPTQRSAVIQGCASGFLEEAVTQRMRALQAACPDAEYPHIVFADK